MFKSSISTRLHLCLHTRLHWRQVSPDVLRLVTFWMQFNFVVNLRCETTFNYCTSSPCVNGACVSQLNGYICNCLSGYTGTNCQTDINECSSLPCQNGATCLQPFLNMYSCACRNNNFGYNCEYTYRACSSSPCRNGGVCVETNFGQQFK